MGLNDIGAKLPPGFRFYPNDEELVCHYLYKKIANSEEDALKATLVEIDLHICEPWQLPEVAKLNSSEWYFFSFRDRKYSTGYRTNRATKTGYWKATGKDRTVNDPNTGALVGMRKTLVFYKNRAPNGIKTGWIMHEFRLENPHIPPKEDWVLCRVFYKAKGDIYSNEEFKSQNNNVTTSPNNTDSYDPLNHMTEKQPPPSCGCYHHITTTKSQISPLVHRDQSNNIFHSLLPQLSDHNTCSLEESTNVCLNDAKYNQDHESGLFSDIGFDFSIPSLMEFGDDENNEENGMVFF